MDWCVCMPLHTTPTAVAGSDAQGLSLHGWVAVTDTPRGSLESRADLLTAKVIVGTYYRIIRRCPTS